MSFLKILVVLILLSCYSASDAQTSFKQLESDFASASDSETKVTLGLDLANHFVDLYSDSTLYYTSQVQEFALKTKDKESRILALRIESKYHQLKRDFSKAGGLVRAALLIADELKDVTSSAILKDELALVYVRQGKYTEAVALMEDALKEFKRQNDSSSISRVISGLGRIFNDRGDYSEADSYHREALKYVLDPKDYGYTLANIGINFKHQNEFDSARYYYLKGLELNPDDIYFRMRSYHNLALIEKRIGNKQEALDYHDKVIAIASSIGDSVKVAIAKVNKTFVYYDLKEFEKAELVLSEEAAIIKAKGTVQEKMDYYLIRYNIAIELNKANNAIQYYQDYRKIVDSLNNMELNTRIAEFETKYETAEKEKLIIVKDQELLKSNQQKKFLLIGLAGILWFGLFGVLYFWSRNKFNKKLAAKELILQEERIAQLQQEKKILSISSMLEGQEQERVRIAQDLHDSIGGLLTTVKIHFGVIQKEIEKIAAIDIGKNVEKLIDEASTEVRRISHNMAPRSLTISGLKATMSDLASEIQSAKNMKVDFEWNGDEIKLDQSKEIAIYRILQELCNNALKHSNADTLLIQVNSYEGKFNLIVEDNGSGFNIADLETFEGIGLKGITSRVEFIDGTLDIDSRLGEGTAVTIVI